MSLDNRSRAQWREVYERAMDDLRHARKRARKAEAKVARAEALVGEFDAEATEDMWAQGPYYARRLRAALEVGE